MSNIVSNDKYKSLADYEKAMREQLDNAKDMSEKHNFGYAKYCIEQGGGLFNIRLDCKDAKVVVTDESGNTIGEDIHKFDTEQVVSFVFGSYIPPCIVSQFELESFNSSQKLHERLFAIIVGSGSGIGWTILKTYTLKEAQRSLSSFSTNKASMLSKYGISMPLFYFAFEEYETFKNKKKIKKATFKFTNDKGELLKPIAVFAKRNDFDLCKLNLFDLHKFISNNPEIVKKAIYNVFKLAKQYTPISIFKEQWMPILEKRVQDAENLGANARYDKYLLELTQEFLGNENIKYEIVTE